MALSETIRTVLTRDLAAERVEVEDESRFHLGHVGAGGGGHFRVLIVSSRFEGVPMVRRHRLVYEALREEMGGAIHALALRTLTPTESTAEGQPLS